ncbi:cardiolipin synthase [Terrilactibacillus laevilacticus]|uniref:cardiolipin synthase n=1 Tax=Terrilactibacillus laevilacticus TaxID=1380157 RepID=UPI001146AAFB|nr:cardiolipin synthase [Terrilactibacillus laevilacticus]
MKRKLQLLALVIVIFIFLLFVQDWQRWLLESLNIGITLTVYFIAIVIFLENRQPSRTITWLLVLVVFPVIGFIFYIVFGQSARKKRLFQKHAFIEDIEQFHEEPSMTVERSKLDNFDYHHRALMNLAQKLGAYPVSFATDTKILTNGEQTFSAILKAIRNAKHHIHIEYYIVRNDHIGNRIKNALIDKAQEGVMVRFMFDAVGSWRLSKSFIRELADAGVDIIPFFPVKLPVLNNKINFRNHRKIIVIDNEIGFIGGLNIGDEYLGRNKAYGFWRDTHLKVKGEGVQSLQLVFLQDWYYMTGHAIVDDVYLKPKRTGSIHRGAVQMIASSPYARWEEIKNIFFSMITSAKQSIWIASPYLIPDEDILSALKVAALSDIDVRILVPGHPDKKIVYYASRSYFPDLLEAGVRIFAYKEGFMHSKLIVVDHELASIGTANMDMRSFHLNFEVNAFLYKTESILDIVTDFIDDFENSNEIVQEDFNKRSILFRVIESTSRLLSPLL